MKEYATPAIPMPGLPLAMLPILLTIALLAVQIFYYDDFTPHIPLAIGFGITALVGWLQGYRWKDIESGAFRVLHVAMPSIATLIIVGMLVGTWIASGTVPMLIYLGLELIDPSWFLAAAMLMCSLVSLSIGSSWTTVGTVGLALIGIGDAFGVPIYWTAGAVVSGSFFGDKISPLSDTTNLSPAVTETNIFDHIRYMLPTTIPAMLIALTVYWIVGGADAGAAHSLERIEIIKQGLADSFEMGPWQLLPLLVVIGLAFFKVAPIPALFTGVMLGGGVAILTQGATYHDALTFAHSGFSIETGTATLDSLLNRGGVTSMTWVVTLMMFALAFGGALERTRCLESIVTAIMSRLKSFRGLQTSAILTSIATNVVSGDVYLSIALPGRMYKPAYDRMGYSRLNLSRAIEEGGTLVSPLVPWNAGGAFVIGALGLGVTGGDFSSLLYIPLAFACWLSPLFGILYAQMGWFSKRAEPIEEESDEEMRMAEERG
ncbi:sodium:proton antiporter [Litchfieldella anticariensis FP35 = DSM 16096]|uniref:Sodium:proton antiporter n=1 Tax=Litchfieldella anticariensis (strain DSM 16096 / CECT 5854 / CIP 108499 / LMG 22089 / FP35) TaxID=1121939 RepID=S2KM45_LITA3|nr:Na+/H+ antiporter NhaC [Halomonas anticariensis]EPC01533.1 sodium:proton antiporter [Halomonas anticariensis FP35 = DSM 16096]